MLSMEKAAYKFIPFVELVLCDYTLLDALIIIFERGIHILYEWRLIYIDSTNKVQAFVGNIWAFYWNDFGSWLHF